MWVDNARSATLAVATTAMIAVPTLGPAVAGTTEGAEAYDTDVTPPNYAFTIWAPIFAGIALNAGLHLRHPDSAASRATGWWLAAAHATHVGWSLAAQSGRFPRTAVLLPVATALTGVAFRRVHDVADPGRVGPASIGLLLGWTAVASVVNVVAVRGRRDQGRVVGAGTPTRAAVLAAAVGVAAVAGAARRGGVAVAAGSGWALATSALNPARTSTTRVVNVLGAGVIAMGTLRGLRRRSSPVRG